MSTKAKNKHGRKGGPKKHAKAPKLVEPTLGAADVALLAERDLLRSQVSLFYGALTAIEECTLTARTGSGKEARTIATETLTAYRERMVASQ